MQENGIFWSEESGRVWLTNSLKCRCKLDSETWYKRPVGASSTPIIIRFFGLKSGMLCLSVLNFKHGTRIRRQLISSDFFSFFKLIDRQRAVVSLQIYADARSVPTTVAVKLRDFHLVVKGA